jgi:SAM-dependent methyltransferase
MRSDPYLDPSSIESFYRDDYRAIYSVNQEITDFFADQHATGLRIYHWLTKNKLDFSLVFEAGCGAGGILDAFKEKNCQVIGCDYDEKYIQFGQSKGLTLEIGGLESLQKFGRSDLVILCHVLEHLRDPITELKQINQILVPNGLVYIELPGIYTIRDTYEDVALFLQNAHVWHFCLATLDYVMSLAQFERIAGNEIIQAVYRYNPAMIPLPIQPTTHQNILKTLDYVEKMRHLPRLKSGILWTKRVVHGLVGDKFYNFAKNLYQKDVT